MTASVETRVGDIIVRPWEPGAVGEQVLDMAATGRAVLAKVIGDADARFNLFRRSMRATSFHVATVDGGLAGYASVKFGCEGPFDPRLDDFVRIHGCRKGLAAAMIFHAIEARTRSSGLYFYGLDVLPSYRGCGVGQALFTHVIAVAASYGAAFVEYESVVPAVVAIGAKFGAVAVRAPRWSHDGLLIATAGPYIRYRITMPGTRS